MRAGLRHPRGLHGPPEAARAGRASTACSSRCIRGSSRPSPSTASRPGTHVFVEKPPAETRRLPGDAGGRRGERPPDGRLHEALLGALPAGAGDRGAPPSSAVSAYEARFTFGVYPPRGVYDFLNGFGCHHLDLARWLRGRGRLGLRRPDAGPTATRGMAAERLELPVVGSAWRDMWKLAEGKEPPQEEAWACVLGFVSGAVGTLQLNCLERLNERVVVTGRRSAVVRRRLADGDGAPRRRRVAERWSRTTSFPATPSTRATCTASPARYATSSSAPATGGGRRDDRRRHRRAPHRAGDEALVRERPTCGGVDGHDDRRRTTSGSSVLYTTVLADVMDDLGHRPGHESRHQAALRRREDRRSRRDDAGGRGLRGSRGAVQARDGAARLPGARRGGLLHDPGLDCGPRCGGAALDAHTTKGGRGAIMDGSRGTLGASSECCFPSSRAASPADSKGRLDVIATRVPIEWAVCSSTTGDLVIVADGCLAVPQAIEDGVLERAFKKVEGENEVREVLRREPRSSRCSRTTGSPDGRPPPQLAEAPPCRRSSRRSPLPRSPPDMAAVGSSQAARSRHPRARQLEINHLGPDPIRPERPTTRRAHAEQQIRAERSVPGRAPTAGDPGAGDFLFVSVDWPLDPETGQVVGETIEEQTRLTLENVKAVLETGGATMATSSSRPSTLTSRSSTAITRSTPSTSRPGSPCGRRSGASCSGSWSRSTL